MARISGAPRNQGGLMRRLFVGAVYSLTKRKVGRVVQLTAHHPKILWGYGQMEQSHRARFDHALGIEGENFSQGAVCAMPAHRAQTAQR